MRKIRCKKCNAWLFRAAGEIDIEIKCKSCKHINKFKMRVVPYKEIYGKITVTASEVEKIWPNVDLKDIKTVN